MNSFTSLPGQAYNYVYGNYGNVGLIIAGVVLVVAIVSVFIFFDRRK